MEKLKLLQLVPRFPFPLDDGGKIGIANILKEFSKQDIEVTLFSLGDEALTDDALQTAKKYAHIYLCKHNTANTIFRIIKSIAYGHSIYINKHSSRKVIKELKLLLDNKKFDIVHADHSCMAPLALLVASIQKIPCGLRLHNIEWMIWRRYGDNLNFFSPKRLYIEYQAFMLKEAEKKFYNKMNVCFAITEPDKQRALDIAPKANIIVASAGVNPAEWIPDDNIQRNSHELILATTYRWVHNVDALRWFIEKVLPIVKNSINDIKLTLIGKEPPEWLNEYKHLGVDIVGFVDKVQPYLNRANINIAPLFVGGGIRIKILEAMAMELPVIASSVAAEGINASSKDGLFLADNEKDFAKNIIYLCNNFEQARAIGKNAREFILKNYSWSNNVKFMLDEYKKLVTTQ